MKDAVKLQKFSDWQVHLALFSICSAVHPSFCHSDSAIILARLQPRSVPSNQHFVNTVIFLTADQIGREGGGYIPCILPPAHQSVIMALPGFPRRARRAILIIHSGLAF